MLIRLDNPHLNSRFGKIELDQKPYMILKYILDLLPSQAYDPTTLSSSMALKGL